MKIALVILYVILTISGLIFMKLGGNPGTISIQEKTFNFGINLISALGLFCYLCSFLLFTRLVVMFDLSYIMPICTGIVQILTLVSSAVIFKEDFSWNLVLGASMVIVGIIVMNLKLSK